MYRDTFSRHERIYDDFTVDKMYRDTCSRHAIISDGYTVK